MSMAAFAAVPGFGDQRFRAGLQLYTVRDQLAKRPLQTLHAISEIGYREVEMLRNQVTTVAPLLKRVNLQPVSLHFETPLLTGNWAAWQHADMPAIDREVTFTIRITVRSWLSSTIVLTISRRGAACDLNLIASGAPSRESGRKQGTFRRPAILLSQSRF